jgi:hypothetical protein
MAGKCPSCGGPLVDEPGNDVYVCTVCGDLFSRDKLVNDGIVPKYEVFDEKVVPDRPVVDLPKKRINPQDDEIDYTLSRLRRIQWIVMIALWLLILGIGLSLFYSYRHKADVMESKENPLEGTLISNGKNLLTEEYLKEEYKIYYAQENYLQRSLAILLLTVVGVFTVYIIMAALGSIVRARVTGKPLNKASFYKSLAVLIFLDLVFLVFAIWGMRGNGPSPEKASYSVYKMEYLGKYSHKSGKTKTYVITYMKNDELQEKHVSSSTYDLYPKDTCTLYVAVAQKGASKVEFHTYREDAYMLP